MNLTKIQDEHLWNVHRGVSDKTETLRAELFAFNQALLDQYSLDDIFRQMREVFAAVDALAGERKKLDDYVEECKAVWRGERQSAELPTSERLHW